MMIDYKLLANTAMLAGEIMLCSGAETYRVEDTMNHILKTANMETTQVIAMMTGIVVTLNDSCLEQPLTLMRRVSERSTNVSNIIKVNDISRRYCEGKITLEEAYEELKVAKGKQYSRLLYNVATIGIAVGFAMMFGGSLHDIIAAAIVGTVLAGVMTVGKIAKLSSVLVHVLSGLGIAMLTVVIQRVLFSDLSVNIVIASSIMPIVPGVAITNAIRDTIQGDYLSGCARILEAFLVAMAIAVGAGLGLLIVGGVI
jgi:uncharacterized membrane protein YjjP (DUF1212 family)